MGDENAYDGGYHRGARGDGSSTSMWSNPSQSEAKAAQRGWEAGREQYRKHGAPRESSGGGDSGPIAEAIIMFVFMVVFGAVVALPIWIAFMGPLEMLLNFVASKGTILAWKSTYPFQYFCSWMVGTALCYRYFWN